MRKLILSMLSLLVGLNVMAQTVYVCVDQSKSTLGDGTGVMYGFDLSSPQTVSEIAFSDDHFNYTISHGALVEDVYYAIIETGEGTKLASFNCETNTKTIIGSFRYNFELTKTDRVNILGMTYDNNAKKLYVMADAAFYNEGEDKTETFHGIFECNPKTCRLTEVSRFYDNTVASKKTDYDFLNTFASDNNGGIYAISIKYSGGYIKKLYKIDVATGNVNEVGDINGMMTGINTGVSLALQDNGKLLYMCGTGEYGVAEIDPADCSLTYKTNVLKKSKYLSIGICFAKSTADGEIVEEPDPVVPENDSYKVKVVETIGDVLGTDPTGCTYKTYSFYNDKNQLVREASYGKLLSDTGAPVADDEATYQLERYKQYNYNELGQLVTSWTEQYGIFDGTDLAYKESYDRVNYYYNDLGQLILEDCVGEKCQYSYEYDEAGNRIKYTRLQLDSYDRNQNGDKEDYYVLWTLNYSDFVNGKATKVTADGEFSNYQYTAVLTYDENGNLIEEVRTNYSDKNTDRFVWTYKGKFLAKYQEFKWKSRTTTDEDGNPVKEDYWFEELYTEYTPEVENPNRVVRHDYVWDEWATTPGWSKNMVYTITESAEFGEIFAPGLTITPVEGEINTAQLSIVPPTYALTQQAAFDIYRKGQIIGRVHTTDLDSYDAEAGAFFFIDKDAPNGTYDYWVQTMLMDELGEEVTEGKNVAIVQEYTHQVELPGVVNFYVDEVIPYTTTATDDEGVTTTYHGNYGRIVWDAPADEETMNKLGFVRYNVYQDRMKAADNFEADGQACTWDFDFYENTTYDIYIQTVYKYGKVNSETKTLSIEIAPKETTYQFACAMNDWGMTDFTKIEGKDNKYEVTFDEFTGEFKVYVDKDLFNCYTMGQYDIAIENPFVVSQENELVGPDHNNPAMCVTETYKNVTFTLTVEEGKLYLYMMGENVGIDAVDAENGLYNVYNYQGIRVLNNADKDAVKALPAGFYIVNGKKVVIR